MCVALSRCSLGLAMSVACLCTNRRVRASHESQGRSCHRVVHTGHHIPGVTVEDGLVGHEVGVVTTGEGAVARCQS